MTHLYEKAAILGLGLIGSSLCLAMRKRGLAGQIAGFAPSAETRAVAAELQLCDVCDRAEDAVKDADLVILCAPVGAMADLTARISPHLRTGATVSDVGSVKQAVIAAVSPHIPAGVHFIPAHPLAGTEKSGPRAGFDGLFDGRWCIFTPDSGVPADCLTRFTEFWQGLGSNVETMTPEHHDLVLAVTSHAPHLIAYTMVGVADDMRRVTDQEVINYSAAGFRDFTRIAASDATMWRDVFLNNREATLEILGRFSEELFDLQRAIRSGDGDHLHAYFTRTRDIRRAIIEAGQDIDGANFGRDK